MGLFDFAKKKQQPQQVQQPVQPQQQADLYTKPADGNYIGLMNEMLGPTPAEREAQERRLAENKAKMNGWLGLFQGLGALGDLYYASKGVNPSKPDYSAQANLNQQFADAQQRLDNLYRNRQAYANMLYNLQRQAGEDARKDKLADAQAQWYSDRSEIARQKAEIDKLKAEKYVELQDGRIAKINAETGKLMEILPLQKEEIQSRINKNNRTGGGGGRSSRANNGTYGYRTTRHVDPATGDVITERVPTTGGKPETKRTPAPKKPAAKSAPQAKKNTKQGNKSGFFNK